MAADPAAQVAIPKKVEEEHGEVDALAHDHPMAAHGAFVPHHHLYRLHSKRLSVASSTLVLPKVKFPNCRLVLMGMSFYAFFCIYSLRVNLSVALVAMVNATYVKEQESLANHTHVRVCDDTNKNDTGPVVVDKEGDFNWDSTKQAIVLAAFFYGYIFTQIPGGMLAQRVGGKLPLLFGITWTAILTILTPIATRYGDFAAIVAVRVLEGLGEGVTYPSMHAMLSKWAPPLERSKMVTSVYAGAQVGTVIGMPLSGILCLLSWDSVFYVFGAIGCVWAVMWIFLVYDSPAQHPRIEEAEKHYIEKAQGLLGSRPRGPIPWKSILTSLPVWATIVSHFTNNWGYYTLLTCLPSYLKYVQGFDIKKNGLISALPYVAMWIIMGISGWVADKLIRKNIFTTTTVRKLANSLGFIIPGICLIGVGFVGCNQILAVALIITAVGTSGISMAGWAVNHLDLAPPYAGTLMGITNMIATVPGFVGPSVVSAFTSESHTSESWRNVFYVAGGVYLFGTIFYCAFGSGAKQKWASGHSNPASPNRLASNGELARVDELDDD